MSAKKGALPSQMIQALMRARIVRNAQISNVQPSSLDLTLTDEIWRMPSMILPRRGEKIEDLIERCGGVRQDIQTPIEPGVVYFVRLEETLELPQGLYGFC